MRLCRLCPACRTSGPSPGPATCIDFDVLLPVKLQEKIAPAVDPLLEDKQVSPGQPVWELGNRQCFANLLGLFLFKQLEDKLVSQSWPGSQGLCRHLVRADSGRVCGRQHTAPTAAAEFPVPGVLWFAVRLTGLRALLAVKKQVQ